MSQNKHAILVVDDEPENVRALRRVFRKQYDVHMANSGAEALELLKDVQVSCVISDQRMPGMTGVELLTRVRELNPETMRMILTGYTDVEDIISSINDGHIYRFITKPWNKEDLEVTIRRALDHFEQTRRVRILLKELELKNQELQELDRMKSEFMTIASHELRTPLAKISGYTELIARGSFGELNEKQTRGVRILRESTERLVDITNHIMDATRLEQPVLELEKQELDLSALLEETHAEMEPLAGQRNQSLTLQVDPNLGPISGSKEALHKILINLVMNAIRFTPDEGKIELKGATTEGGVEITVQDTGIGIEPHLQERIFDKFFAVKNSDYHFSGTFEFLSGGMGLGLAIAKKLVEAHQGQISVTSTLEQGSTFRVFLPRS